ncbi:fungal-specific transcription factor domain-containing protein [Mycena rosella]|uniref:Fungal-specific transcription factor domain-containing protein n=1 Tax=Mycena rosella TaxID=1033263 RepID=A0AAD7DQK1_MYCRO|nr:fungal-specific transcription factor domain-containing protein [Mycena rosella]
MSSDEETPSPPAGSQLSLKARRVQRSCDICRQRKIRCETTTSTSRTLNRIIHPGDGSKMPDGQCSNCIAFGSSCTYVRPTKKRGPKNQLVEELKQRNMFLEAKNASLEAKLRSLSICSLCSQPLADQDSPSSSASAFGPAGRVVSRSPEHVLPKEEDTELADRFNALCIQENFLSGKFFGNASSFVLVSSAIAQKEKYLGRPAPVYSRRLLFWHTLPWEREEYEKRPHYVYPPSDLMVSLLDLYFTNVHPILPILHRPSFERSVAEGLYLKDTQFGGALLAVLAVASRYSNDPRVFVDGGASLSSGWKFINQVEVVRKLFNPSLYEVQFYCLMTMYYLGTSAPQSSWLYLGLGIRSLQQRGEHRRKRTDVFDPEEESWKRAFWCCFSLDRLVCLFLGRPAGIHSEDYDVDLPLEVDDEYWGKGLTQPPGKPSLLTYFVCHLRLSEILADALRRLYASKKSRALMGWSGPEWEQRTVSELDSAMNDWLDSVPTHLRWDPERTRDVFSLQSAVLHMSYYSIQIAIHRPYIHQPNILASPSLSICTSAARSTLHIADAWLNKMQSSPLLPFLMNPVFVSGVILMLNIFGNKRAGFSTATHKDLLLVETAIEFHKCAESRWQPAGRVRELLQELKSLDCPLLLRQLQNEAPSVPNECMNPDKIHPNHGQPFEPIAWNSMHSSHSSAPLGQNPGARVSVEQLLADTAEFDTVNLSSRSPGNPSGLSNGVIDDELMSLWMVAPTNFTSIPQWDAYIGADMTYVGTGMTYVGTGTTNGDWANGH